MKSNFILNLERRIGEQKIDVLLNTVKFPDYLPIYEVAKKDRD